MKRELEQPHSGHLIISSRPQLLQTFLPSEISFMHPHLQILIFAAFSDMPPALYAIFSILQNAVKTSTGSKLCGQCEIVFKDDSSKEAYDRYLEYVRRKIILDDAKSIAEISDELTIEQGDEIIGQLTEVFRDRKMAEDVLTAFCKIEKIAYNAGGPNEPALFFTTSREICNFLASLSPSSDVILPFLPIVFNSQNSGPCILMISRWEHNIGRGTRIFLG